MKRNKISRYYIVSVIVVLLTCVIFAKLFNLQVVNGVTYRQQSERRLLKSHSVTATRGEITDRYGRPLVTSRMGFDLIAYKEYIEDKNLNQLILDTIKILDEYDVSYYDTLPISEIGEFIFDSPDYSAEAEFKEDNEFDSSMTAKEILDELIKRYEIDSKYTAAEKRKIAGVRFEMELRTFNTSTPYTIASDVPMEVVSYIREQSSKFTGIDVSVEPIRVNVNGTIASHILGRVGRIYKEEYDVLKSKGYGMNDILGKDGIEKIMEYYLKGTDGVQSVEQSIDGRTMKILESQEPVPGNNVILTLDLELQKIAEESLAETISNMSTNSESLGANAGAVVVVDVNSGEILAISSYPTFNQNTFNEDYKSLLENQAKPMWNRAISGTYAPGSTFKMLTAVAALESGVTTTGEIIKDLGVYRYYESSNYTPKCWIFTDTGRTHGNQNVVQAIENSCSYYFYEVGRRMGIDTLADYGKKFGLGEYTGIELSGEAKGIFASRAYREKINSVWYPGDTLQASIGQSDHLFTPIQLANYVATLANGGTRYKLHLIKEVKSGADSKTIMKNEPEIVEKIDISNEHYKAIMEGMKAVSETGTASNVFAGYPIQVGGKTGTASVSSGTANALFVAVAPLDDPQIAIAIVVEHGGHGNYVAPIAKNIISYYMQLDSTTDNPVSQNTLIP